MHNDQIFIDIDVYLKNTAASPHPQIVSLRSKPLDSIVQPRSFCTRSSMARRVVGLATLSKSCAADWKITRYLSEMKVERQCTANWNYWYMMA